MIWLYGIYGDAFCCYKTKVTVINSVRRNDISAELE